MLRWRFLGIALAEVGFAGGCAEVNAPPGEEIGQAQQAIYKGTPDNQAHPQVMDLVVPSSGSAIGCTGVLISGRVLLTAAHCALTGTSPNAPLELDPQSYAILPNNLDDARKATFLATVPTPQGVSAGTLKPAEVLIHPSYDEKRNAAYDVMLLVLPHPIPRSVMKPLRVSGGYGYGSGPSFWEGYTPRFLGVGPSDDACQGQAGIPVRFLDNATVKEASTFFRFKNGGADGHTCFGDSGGPYLTRAAQNGSHPGHTLSDSILISILSQTLDGGAGDDVGPVLEEGWIRGWLEANALDRDGDWMESWVDKCDEHPGSSLEAQDDKDNDGVGDACDRCPADPDNGDADGDRILNCLDPCPDNPLNPDSDADGLADCVDPCPSEGKLNAKDPWGDADFDGVCNAADNCPLAANLTQRNANRRFEEAQKVDILGDWCDPVPVPDFTPLTEVVDDPAGLVPCVDPECPGFTPADQAFLKCGSIFHNALSMRPIRSQHRTNVNLFQEVKGVGTVARFCQIEPLLDITCVEAQSDIQEKRLHDAECAVGCQKPETHETRFHRVSCSTGCNADPDGPPVPLDYTLKPSAPDPGIVWTWDYQSDYQRWMSVIPPLINPPVVTGSAADVFGNFWTHALTTVGADPSVPDPGFYHGGGISGHHGVSLTTLYDDVSGFYPEKQGCYACVHLQYEDLAWDAGGGSSGSPNSVPPPFFFWRPSEDAAGDAYRRFDAVPGEASYLVRGPKGLFAAVRSSEGDCNGELVHERLGDKFRARLSTPTVVWISAAEPSAMQGADPAFPVAVALSSTTADLVDVIQEKGGSLLADADRATTRLSGVSVPNVTRFAAVLSRVRRGVYVIGGEDVETGAPSGRVWFRSLEGRVWKRLPDSDYHPEKVLAATYSVAMDALFVLDALEEGTARLKAVDPQSGAAKTVGAWPRDPSWDLHWLVADHDGAVLLASASRSLSKHALTRIAMASIDTAPTVSRLEGEGALVLPPLVDASGYTQVLRSGPKGKGVLTARLRTLPLAPASLTDVGQAL